MKTFAAVPSPLGCIHLGASQGKLCHLWMEQQRPAPDFSEEMLKETGADPALQAAADWLEAYFAGKNPDPASVPLNLAGTPFQNLIWTLLQNIPYGEVTTYKKLARQAAEILNKPRMSAQAVGQAVSHNPVSILVPCHRVIGTGGKLTGYNGGIEKKIFLLELEGVDTAWFSQPQPKRWQASTGYPHRTDPSENV